MPAGLNVLRAAGELALVELLVQAAAREQGRPARVHIKLREK